MESCSACSFTGRPRRARGVEHARDLGGGEGDGLAEPVDGVDQAFRGERGQHIVGDERDIFVALAFLRQRVGAEEAGLDDDIARLAEAARRAQHLALGCEVEAVAGFDLDRGDALGDQRVEAAQGLGDQRVLARGARGGDGGEDAAAGARDLLVGRAGEPQLEFARAVAAVDRDACGNRSAPA